MGNNNQYNTRDYILVGVLLAISTFDYFIRDVEFLILAFILVLFIGKNTFKTLNDNIFVFTLSTFIVITVVQFIIFNQWITFTLISNILRILLAYLVVISTGRKFLNCLYNVIYAISLFSILIFILIHILPGGMRSLADVLTPYFVSPFQGSSLVSDSLFEIRNNNNILIYNFHGTLYNQFSQYLRNSGPYWEPSVNAGISIIALSISLILHKKFLNRKNIVIIINIISTFSTVGYVALFFVFIFYLYTRNNNITFIFIGTIFFLISVSVYNSQEFLRSKISDQLTQTEITESGELISTGGKPNRFAAALVDFYDFLQHPIFGRGTNIVTRFDQGHRGYDFRAMHRNNGVTHYLLNFGIIGFILYFYLIYYSFKTICKTEKKNKHYPLFFILLLFIIGFSQLYFHRPFFYAFLFLYAPYKTQLDEKQ